MSEKAKKNTYDPKTPEWQLFENMESARSLEASHTKEVEKYTKLAREAREKRILYEEALEILKKSKKEN